MNSVKPENLVVDNLYYITSLSTDDDNNMIENDCSKKSRKVGIFINMYISNNGIFNSTFDWFPISKLKNIKKISDIKNIYKYRVTLNCWFRFYELKRFKIQENMEIRGINLVLKKIINDDYAFWIYKKFMDIFI